MEKVFTLILTEQEISIIGQLLGEAPYKVSAPLINKLTTQIQEQEKEKEITPEKE